MRRASVFLLFLLYTGQSTAAVPDYAREARLADEIVDAILDGEAYWLSANEREFLSIFTEAEDSASAVIILHGRGFHPDWVDTVQPLRVGLVDRGYTTLSLQMPVLGKEAKYYDYLPILKFAHARIEAGIEFLRQQGYRKIILLAHSCGVHMAMSWIEQRGDASIDAFIGLGMGATDYKQPMLQDFPLQRMQKPVLDLYGAREYPAVIRMAPRRKQLIEKAANPLSRQLVLADADHYFVNRGDAMLDAVASWLQGLRR